MWLSEKDPGLASGWHILATGVDFFFHCLQNITSGTSPTLSKPLAAGFSLRTGQWAQPKSCHYTATARAFACKEAVAGLSGQHFFSSIQEISVRCRQKPYKGKLLATATSLPLLLPFSLGNYSPLTRSEMAY